MADDNTTTELTELLHAWKDQDPKQMERLVPLLYQELRVLAASHLRRERPDHTLQRTALVNEVFMRLMGQRVDWENRSHFFGVASRLMRRVLVDYARKGHAEKRGGHMVKVEIEKLDNLLEYAAEGKNPIVLTVHHALEKLEDLDPRQARLVELRFFGGHSIEEAADLMGISASTAKREWKFVRAWLKNEILKESGSSAGAASAVP
jgi:RNA polymerase sigma factor (TIGR02999 family)